MKITPAKETVFTALARDRMVIAIRKPAPVFVIEMRIGDETDR